MARLKCADSEDPLVPRWSIISESSTFWIEGPLSGEYLRGAFHPTLAKQVYECSCEEIMNQAGKGFTLSALIDRVHNAGRLVQSQHEKILTLRATNKELKAGVGQELVTAGERAGGRNRKDAEGQKAMAAYKASRGFESSLNKMGRVSYEFGYRAMLERLRGKHPNIMIEQDPFAECSEDANVEMDLDQPFDNDTPSKKQPTM
ncbi:hypothetical protein B296_00050493 [Ensete ventricosum]|uniref:Uncharacterized protein n=1 Tax=Ensete ventricosum TaxID=4639 RepID=A0A426Y013_ENSVE|nr:hypothetical protein B296_00050493 [Ensete ventricosum]